MATTAEIEAAIAKAEAAGRKDLADKLRTYLPAQTSVQPDAIQAAIAKAEAAGRTDLADKLRGYLPATDAQPAQQPKPAPTIGQDPPRIKSTSEQGHDLATEFAGFEMFNPELKGRYTPETMPKPGDVVMGQGGGGKSGGARMTVRDWRRKPQAPDTFGDTAGAMMEGPLASAQAFGEGLYGGQSPSYNYLKSDPATSQLPDFVNGIASKVGDLGGLALSGLGAGVAGLTGLATEFIPGLPSAGEKEIAQGALLASQFAVPELSGVSSVPARMATVAPKMEAAAPKAASVAETLAPKAAPIVTDEAIATTIGAAAKASKQPKGAASAKLAADAAPDQATIAAAERLGFDLPADVYATNPLIRRAAGGARGIVGSEAEGHWIGTVTKAINNAGELFGKITSGDVSVISERVSNQLGTLQATLKSEANRLYTAVEKAVPKTTPVSPQRAIAMLEGRAADLGGVEKLAPAERALLTELKANPTYEWVKTQKGKLGEKAFGVVDQFPNFNKAFSRRITGALSEDLVDAAGAVGGKEARDALRLANQLTAKQHGIQERIISAFGKDGMGSVAPKISAALRAGAKGDVTGLNKLLRILPEETRADAILAGIEHGAKGSGLARNGMGAADGGGFGFAEFSKFWGGIRSNRRVENIIQDAVGNQAKGLLDDLYRVSRALTDARANVSTTGKANQWLEMVPRGVIERMASSNTAQQVVKKGAVGVGATAGPVGAVVASGLVDAINFGSKSSLEASSKLFRSPEFLDLMKKADATPETIAANPAVKRWAASQGIKDVAGWVRSIGDVRAPAAVIGAEAANSNQQPGYESLWGKY